MATSVRQNKEIAILARRYQQHSTSERDADLRHGAHYLGAAVGVELCATVIGGGRCDATQGPILSVDVSRCISRLQLEKKWLSTRVSALDLAQGCIGIMSVHFGEDLTLGTYQIC